MKNAESVKLKSGYAYRSTKRHPRDPDTVIVVESELSDMPESTDQL